MQKRGRIQVGSVANLTIFDAANVIENVDWKPEKTSLPSTAIRCVILNGTIVVKHSERPETCAGASITLRTAEGVVCGPSMA